jgi:hypothetical protein
MTTISNHFPVKYYFYAWIILHYIYIYMYIYIHIYTIYILYIFLTHSSVDRHIGQLHILAIINSSTINMGVQVSQLYGGLHSFEYIYRSSKARSYSSFIFSFLEESSCYFFGVCTNLCSLKQCIRFPFSLFSHLNLLLFCFGFLYFVFSFFLNKWWDGILVNLSFVSNYIQLFICLLDICTWKAHFLKGWVAKQNCSCKLRVQAETYWAFLAKVSVYYQSSNSKKLNLWSCMPQKKT